MWISPEPSCHRRLAGAVAALALGLAAGTAAACTLPPDVAGRIGRAQEFAYHIPDLAALKGKRDYVWNGNTGRGRAPAGVFSSAYVVADRAPFQGPDSSRRLAWFQAHHPDWIVYRPDGKTPAWEFCTALDASCDGEGDVPLAIWKPAVRAFMEKGDVQRDISAGIYQGISADNVDPSNVFFKGGTCSAVPDSVGCAHAGGTWTPRYSQAFGTISRPLAAGATRIPVADSGAFAAILARPGGENIEIRGAGAQGGLYSGSVVRAGGGSVTVSPAIASPVAAGVPVEAVNRVDARLAGDWAIWLSELRAYADARGSCLSINLSYETYNRANWARLAAIPDIVYDEQGFGGDEPKICKPGGGTAFKFYGGNWVEKATDYAGLGTPLVLEGAACSKVAAADPEITYDLASYMLVKKSHTYATLFYRDPAAFEDYSAEFYLEHGAPDGPMRRNAAGVYYRRFAKALALLNPSPAGTASYDLGAGVYHNRAGRRLTGPVVLPPVTGMILLPGEPASPGTKPVRR